MMHTNEVSGKKAIPKRTCSRDAPKSKDENFQLCPRSGCSGRLNYTRTGCTSKPSSSRQTSNPSNGKEVVGSSSRPSPLTRRSHTKPSSHIKTDEEDETMVKDQTPVLRPGNVRFGPRTKPITAENGNRTTKSIPTPFPLPHSSQPRSMKKNSSGSESGSSSSSVKRPISKEGRGVIISDEYRNVTIRPRTRDQNNRKPRFPQAITPSSHMLSPPFQFSVDTSAETRNHDEVWRFNMDEELAFLSSMSFFDHHRDMRLDIDDMSYEELLALGERMGTVSTALSEEAMLKSLSRSEFQVSFKEGDEDDSKCSICQEEYVIEDEIGKMECEHRFHLGCIQKWLRMKNWCPICKASAVSSPPS